MTTALFLPGAGGRRSFWQPVAARIGPGIEPVVLGWPGFGDEPRDETIQDLEGLAGYVRARMAEPSDVVAQSMGGVIALMLALRRPELVRRLVLTGTSGGFDVTRFGAEDWRAGVGANAGDATDTPGWFVEDYTDLSDDLSRVTAPTLLIWGEQDRISPPAVGEYLASVLPHARLEVVEGDHDHPHAHPAAAAGLIRPFLLQTSPIHGGRT